MVRPTVTGTSEFVAAGKYCVCKTPSLFFFFIIAFTQYRMPQNGPFCVQCVFRILLAQM